MIVLCPNHRLQRRRLLHLRPHLVLHNVLVHLQSIDAIRLQRQAFRGKNHLIPLRPLHRRRLATHRESPHDVLRPALQKLLEMQRPGPFLDGLREHQNEPRFPRGERAGGGLDGGEFDGEVSYVETWKRGYIRRCGSRRARGRRRGGRRGRRRRTRR